MMDLSEQVWKMGQVGYRDHACIFDQEPVDPRPHDLLQFCGGVTQQVSECQERKHPW